MMRMIKPSLDRIFNGDPPRDEVEEYLSAFIGHAERTRISAAQAREDISKVFHSCLNLPNRTSATGYCYSGLRTILNDLRIARSSLASSLERIDEEIVALKHYASDISVKTSFTCLPDEIFGIIFEFAGYQDLKSVAKISGVCRRFRNITLSIPHLWRFISVRGYRIEDAIALAERSKCPTPGLSINMGARPYFLQRRRWDGDETEYRVIALNFVNTYSSRVTSLAIDLDFMQKENDNVQWTAYSSISLPFLESLKLSVKWTHITHNELGLEQLDRHWETYRSWDMPLLRSLHAVNLFPELPTTVLSTIKEFILDIDVEHNEAYTTSDLDWSLATLVQYISSMSSLEELSIATVDTSKEHFPDNIQEPLMLKLASLRHLSIRVVNYDAPFFRRFFQAFDLRDLGSLSINVRTNSKEILNIEEWPSNIYTLSRLAHFSLIIRPVFPHPDSAFLDFFNHVQNVYFEVIGHDNYPFNLSNRLLCTIRIKNRDGNDNHWFPQWETIEKEYRRCRDGELDKCFVLDDTDLIRSVDYYVERFNFDFENTEYSQKKPDIWRDSLEWNG